MSLPQPIVLLVHKQRYSARTRFVLFNNETVCIPGPLPNMASFTAFEDRDEDETVALHPAHLGRSTANELGLEPDDIEMEAAPIGSVSTPEGDAQVFLAGLTAEDPPFDALAVKGGKFVAITETRSALSDVEMEMLRKAYETVMGG